jgi:ABC-type Na+ efflux pump permease subunit
LPVVFVNAVPGFQPQLIHFFIPAVNAILLFKEVLLRVYDWSHILITFVSLAVYSLVAVYIASRIYSKESVLFKD